MENNDVKNEIDSLVKRAKQAEKDYESLNQEQIDNIVKKMSIAAVEAHMRLAQMAVEETGRGIVEDKITKNICIRVCLSQYKI